MSAFEGSRLLSLPPELRELILLQAIGNAHYHISLAKSCTGCAASKRAVLGNPPIFAIQLLPRGHVHPGMTSSAHRRAVEVWTIYLTTGTTDEDASNAVNAAEQTVTDCGLCE